MSSDQRGQDGYKTQGLPTYVVLDTSGSMAPHEQLLNDTLMHIYDTIEPEFQKTILGPPDDPLPADVKTVAAQIPK